MLQRCLVRTARDLLSGHQRHDQHHDQVVFLYETVKAVYNSTRKPISELRSVICHVGSQRVPCIHPKQVNVPRLNPSQYLIYLPLKDGRQSWPWRCQNFMNRTTGNYCRSQKSNFSWNAITCGRRWLAWFMQNQNRCISALFTCLCVLMTLATQTSAPTTTTTTDVTTMSSTYSSRSASTSLTPRSAPRSGCLFYKKKC